MASPLPEFVYSAAPDRVLALVQSSSLPRLMAEAVEKMILSGEAAPGSKLNEMTLADRFGVSRGPLREAFRLLEESGLIRQEKNRGAFVRQIELQEASEIYAVRAGLDATAGRLLAGRLDETQLAMLQAMIGEMHVAARDNDVDAFHTLNLEFHERLIRLTANAYLHETYQRSVKVLTLFRRRNLLVPQAIADFTDEHAAIVDALASGSGELAAQLLYQHAEGGRQRMMRIHAQDAESA